MKINFSWNIVLIMKSVYIVQSRSYIERYELLHSVIQDEMNWAKEKKCVTLEKREQQQGRLLVKQRMQS